MTTFLSGRQAEAAAVAYLQAQKFKILGQNWKTRFCEIDIVAQKDKRIYFIEVKYRARSAQGEGLEYITPRKLGRMKFAAEVWVQSQRWNGDYSLSAVEVAGPLYQVTNFLPDLT